MHPMLNIAVRAARNAGNVITRAMGNPERIETEVKSANDFVTSVDREAERVIVETLRKAYPDHDIIGEEGGQQTGGNSDYQWIIDPLDGTTNFMRGIPHFAVSIALRVKGKTEVGVVFDPVRNELFTAERGGGAQLNNTRIRVGETREIKDALLVTGFPFRNRNNYDSFLRLCDAVFQVSSDVRRTGSAALDLAYVAAGRVDGYYELGLKPWDFAAGELLVREAGGLVTDFAGGSNYYNSGNVVATNPRLAKPLLTTMRAHLTDATAR